MSKVNKKFLALAATAALSVAGVAFATGGAFVVSGNGVSGDNGTTPLTATDTVAPTAQAQAAITGNGTVTNAVDLSAFNMGVNVAAGDTISFAPANDAGRKERITGTAGVAANAFTKVGAGTLVMAAGYGNDPLPGDVDTWNNYSGITRIDEGTLVLRHSNAIGFSALSLSGDTTLVVNDRDMSLGYQDPAGASLNVAGQTVTVTNNMATATFEASNVRPVHIDTDARNLALTQRVLETKVAGDYNGILLHKLGSGVLTINNALGTNHTGGTHVEAGTLNVSAPDTSSSRYDTPLGAIWVAALDPAKDIYAGNANLAGTGKPAFDNALTVDSGATLIVNRDKAFGSFNGAGNVVVNSYNNGVLPFVTVWNNNDAAANARAFNSAFTGNITGSMNFVLDARAQNSDLALEMQSLRLTGANSWNGQTWVVDGILSAKGVESIGNDVVRVGFDGQTTPANGLSDRTYTTQNAATLHFSGSTTVAKSLIAEHNAGLAADNSAVVTYNDVALYENLEINPFLAGSNTQPSGYTGIVRFDKAIKYNGTAAAPTIIDVNRGTLQLHNVDTDIAEGDFAHLRVSTGGTLAFGSENQEMRNTYEVSVVNGAGLEGYINANNVSNTMQADDVDKAIMRLHTLNLPNAGGPGAADEYITVNLVVNNPEIIKAGTYIPILSVANTVNNPSWLYDKTNGRSRVRAFVTGNGIKDDNLQSVYLEVLDQSVTAQKVVYAKVLKDLAPVDPGKPDPKPQPEGSSSSSGCSTGAFASFAGLLLAPLAFLRKKD